MSWEHYLDKYIKSKDEVERAKKLREASICRKVLSIRKENCFSVLDNLGVEASLKGIRLDLWRVGVINKVEDLYLSEGPFRNESDSIYSGYGYELRAEWPVFQKGHEEYVAGYDNLQEHVPSKIGSRSTSLYVLCVEDKGGLFTVEVVTDDKVMFSRKRGLNFKVTEKDTVQNKRDLKIKLLEESQYRRERGELPYTNLISKDVKMIKSSLTRDKELVEWFRINRSTDLGRWVNSFL